MNNLINKVHNALEVLDRYGVSETKQEEILTKGVRFDFTYGDPDFNNQNRHLDFFKVAELIREMERRGYKVNINDIVYSTWQFEYPELVREIADRRITGTARKRTRDFDPYGDPM